MCVGGQGKTGHAGSVGGGSNAQVYLKTSASPRMIGALSALEQTTSESSAFICILSAWVSAGSLKPCCQAHTANNPVKQQNPGRLAKVFVHLFVSVAVYSAEPWNSKTMTLICRSKTNDIHNNMIINQQN